MSVSKSQPIGVPSAEKFHQMYATASAASVGLEMALGVVVGWAIGRWLDAQLGTDPWLMLLMLLCGVAAGFKGVLRVARASRRAEEAEQASKSLGSPS